MTEPRAEIGIQPLVNWPRTVQAGRSYRITVDLRLTDPAAWPYDEEELVVGCMIDGRPTCRVLALGDAGVVLHRFGGSYGPARFLAEVPADRTDFTDAALWLTLTTAGGVPFYTGRLPLDGSPVSGLVDANAATETEARIEPSAEGIMVAKVATPEALDLELPEALEESRADRTALSPTEHSLSVPFLVVDRNYLDQERRKPKEPYIASPPTWADVVHGADHESRFLERDQYGSLLSEVNRLLVEPLRRGSDQRLPTLFVTGAPGCGKSTLVRHVAATLIDRGDVLVADLGVNPGRLSIDDLDSYAKSLADLSRAGPPVLLLMDDPFFANSGWDLLLERLARRNYSNVAVLGTSPTYLYDTYARRIADRQVILNRFDLHPTTLDERITLAQMYGIEDDAVLDSDENLLVFAMETVTGRPFDEIILRIWRTLNDGISVVRKARAEDVQWPVTAFLLICYLHRHYVMCPEPLLRNALLRLNQGAQTDYVSELSELVLSEGWHIFQISWQKSGARPTALIGTMHARIAERAWQLRPMKTIDTAEWLANASVDVPECTPQLAEFILACQLTIDPQDRRFVQRVAELWDSRKVSTAQLGSLVRGIRGSPQAAMLFRRSLRERLRRRDSGSWLAAVELINLARRGSAERNHLEQVDLPACLKRANLASGSEVAIEILGRRDNPAKRREFIETLCASLEGELDWEPDGTLLIWLLANHRLSALRSLMPRMYEWLESHPDEVQLRVALMQWYRARITGVPYAELQVFWDEARQWPTLLPGSTAVPLAALSLVDAMLKANVPLPNDLFAEIFAWLRLQPDDASLRRRFLSLAVKVREQSSVTTDVIEETRAWLRDHTDDAHVRAALLALVRAVPGSPSEEFIEETRAWLRDHPEDVYVRRELLALVRMVPESPAAAMVIEEIRAWLHDNPSDARVYLALHEDLENIGNHAFESAPDAFDVDGHT